MEEFPVHKLSFKLILGDIINSISKQYFTDQKKTKQKQIQKQTQKKSILL